MGSGQARWEDDEIELHCREMNALFRLRSKCFDQKDTEKIVSELFRHLDGQQLTRQTWGVMDRLRKHLTQNTPDDCALYHREGYWFKKN